MRSTRRVISAAARREKVSSMMRRGVDPVDDEMRHTVRQRIGLAGARAGNDQERRRAGEVRAAEFNGAALLWIEMREVGRGHRGGRAG